MCPVPDSRLDSIAELYPDKEKKPATVDFVDLAGMSYGEIKSSAYIDFLRRADGLTHVVRGFYDPQIPHPKGKISPKDDILSMATALEIQIEHYIAAEIRRIAEDKGVLPSKLSEIVLYENGVSGYDGEREVKIGSAEFLSREIALSDLQITEKDKTDIENYSCVYMSYGGNLIAAILFGDQIREESYELVQYLQGLKYL